MPLVQQLAKLRQLAETPQPPEMRAAILNMALTLVTNSGKKLTQAELGHIYILTLNLSGQWMNANTQGWVTAMNTVSQWLDEPFTVLNPIAQ